MMSLKKFFFAGIGEEGRKVSKYSFVAVTALQRVLWISVQLMIAYKTFGVMEKKHYQFEMGNDFRKKWWIIW